MSNNRMYLLHRPTGCAVYLGVDTGYEWHPTYHNLQERITELFKLVSNGGLDGLGYDGTHDDFCIAMDCNSDAPFAVKRPSGPHKDLGSGIRVFSIDTK